MEEGEKHSFSQEQIHDLLFNREIGWQEIIYDLINTEQLDPWDIDISVLSDGFFKKIQEYEEMDFFISSKVLLAAALLLRIKSELILSRYMKSIDSILFGKEEDSSKRELERIELDEEIPFLVPKSPLPRYRKVTLKELIESLNKAVITENRRIRKAIVNKNALRETGISLPKNKEGIKDRLNTLFDKITRYFDSNKNHKSVPYSSFHENDEEKVRNFFPVLQLENNGKVWLEQEEHFGEIHIWLKHIFLKHNPNPYQDLLDGNWNEEHVKEGKELTEE